MARRLRAGRNFNKPYHGDGFRRTALLPILILLFLCAPARAFAAPARLYDISGFFIDVTPSATAANFMAYINAMPPSQSDNQYRDLQGCYLDTTQRAFICPATSCSRSSGACRTSLIGVDARCSLTTGSNWTGTGFSCPDASPNPPKSNGPPSCGLRQGNPINVGTGNKYQEETDYRGTGISPLRFVRHYNGLSATTVSYGMGVKWSQSYAGRVQYFHTLAGTLPSVEFATVVRPDGKAFQFFPNGTQWTSDADLTDRLVRLTDGSGNTTGWTYTATADDSVETYGADGKLLSISDRTGLTQTLMYSDATTPTTIAPGPGLLIRVTDNFSRQLNFTYDAQSRMSTMTDPAGGLYQYAYDANNNLPPSPTPTARRAPTSTTNRPIPPARICPMP